MPSRLLLHFVTQSGWGVAPHPWESFGEWSERMHLIFPDAKLVLFEPQKMCQERIHARHIPNMELIPKALGASEDTLILHSDSELSGLASLHERHDSFCLNSKFHSQSVEVTTLDKEIASRGFGCVDFVKMDIEGHELEAIRGAQESLKAGIIKALAFEFGSGNINSRTFFRDFWEILTQLGFRIYRVLPSSKLMLIDNYYEDCEYFRGVSNYIAVLRNC